MTRIKDLGLGAFVAATFIGSGDIATASTAGGLRLRLLVGLLGHLRRGLVLPWTLSPATGWSPQGRRVDVPLDLP